MVSLVLSQRRLLKVLASIIVGQLRPEIVSETKDLMEMRKKLDSEGRPKQDDAAPDGSLAGSKHHFCSYSCGGEEKKKESKTGESRSVTSRACA